ncbi:MAG TPA: L-histidine N(alpha)-methyltransferase [Burkholderiaceae bacterium]
MTDARSPRFIQLPLADSVDDREAARAALLRQPASAAPKYFYDRLGSHLFEAITELPEYYPTRTEAAIFASHGAAMASAIGAGCSAGKPGITLIDLGAGNCVKASKLFPLLEPRRYVAVDISVEFLREALKRVQREQPALSVVGVGLDFSTSLDLPADLIEDRPVFFYPGSSIGNFAPDEALAFLRRVREHALGPARGGGLLIGVDLVKPHDVLQRAYDDALGVTAAFNLNLLRQLNRLIGSDFEPRQWRHIGLYNPIESRIEMHLEAGEALTVRWHGTERRFAAGERIHTENSYKYTVERFAALLRAAGFGATQHWTDERGWFAVFWASA